MALAPVRIKAADPARPGHWRRLMLPRLSKQHGPVGDDIVHSSFAGPAGAGFGRHRGLQHQRSTARRRCSPLAVQQSRRSNHIAIVAGSQLIGNALKRQ
jgi:hypothetical protein